MPNQERVINTKRSKGFYATVEASYTKLTDTSAMRPDGSVVSGYFSPLAASAGFVYRLEGAMPDGAKLGTSKLSLTGYGGLRRPTEAYGGLAMRVISGDLDNADRTSVFGTSARYFLGPEIGATVQIGNVLIGAAPDRVDEPARPHPRPDRVAGRHQPVVRPAVERRRRKMTSTS